MAKKSIKQFDEKDDKRVCVPVCEALGLFVPQLAIYL